MGSPAHTSLRSILDTEFGGQLESGQTRLVTGVPFVQLVPYDADRVSLVVSNEGASAVLLSLSGEASPIGGILLAVGSPPFQLSLGFNGDLCQQAWFATSNPAAGAVFAVFSKRTR